VSIITVNSCIHCVRHITILEVQFAFVNRYVDYLMVLYMLKHSAITPPMPSSDVSPKCTV